jgi:hypothetical protein
MNCEGSHQAPSLTIAIALALIVNFVSSLRIIVDGMQDAGDSRSVRHREIIVSNKGHLAVAANLAARVTGVTAR